MVYRFDKNVNQTRITNAVLSYIVKSISANFVILYIVVLVMLLPQANAKTMTLDVELIRVGRPFGVTRNMRTFWRAALFTVASVVSAFDCHTTLCFVYVCIHQSLSLASLRRFVNCNRDSQICLA